MNSFLKKFIFSAAFFCLLSASGFCLALESSYPSILGNSLSSDPSLPELVSYLVNIGIDSAGILAAIVITIGGILYVVSGLRGGSITEAKEWIKSGVLGLFLLICAYIILYTINPALVSPRMEDLLNKMSFIPTNPGNMTAPDYIFYKEIPMGTIAETVLSKTISCYDYDDTGDPITNEVKTDNSGKVDGPTFLDHDRVDCMLKLNKAIEKKSKIIKNLSKKIAELMQSCACSKTGGAGKDCKEISGTKCPDLPPDILPDDCPKAVCGSLKCECDGGNPNVCEPDQSEFKLCPLGTKKQVQEGPIVLDNLDINSGIAKAAGNAGDVFALQGCMENELPDPKEYKGLQEFTTQLNGQSVINLIESTVKVNKKDVIIMNEKNWDNLKLIEQLMYLREKLNQVTTTLSQDSKNLDAAKKELNKCYLARPYVDYLKDVEKTNKNEKVVMVQKNYDSYQQKFTDISKYCDGFGYENSGCFYTCENTCPSSSTQALSCYKGCQAQDCNALCPTGDPSCVLQKITCIQQQNACINTCFDERPCPNSASGSFQDFQGCMSSCQDECKNTCTDEYQSCKDAVDACETCKSQKGNVDGRCAPVQKACTDCNTCFLVGNGALFCNSTAECKTCTNQGWILNTNLCIPYEIGSKIGLDCNKIGCADELKKCNDKCGDNSKCILSNKEKCLYNPQALIYCGGLNSDDSNLENCVKGSAFTCFYGSSEQAGYPDCLTNPYSLKNTFSSSDIFKNKDQQKCPDPYSPNINSQCYSAKSPKAACMSVCPEVSKCPSASVCPDCPCATIAAPGQSGPCPGGQPMQTCADGTQSCNCPGGNGAIASSSSSSSGAPKITDYEVVGGECKGQKYNDDPLTFYCQQNWWNDLELKNPEPLANSYVCPKENEIPVGQTIDDTQKWARKLLDYDAKFIQKTDELIKHLQIIASEQEYCKCGSECGNGERTCNAPCNPAMVTPQDANGNPTGKPSCKCLNQGCQGNPCQKMINLLLGKTAGGRCPQGVKIDGPIQLYDQIKTQLNTISDFSVKGRTEVVKELTYSRKKMNDCGSESKANSPAQQTKIISCERVDTNFISPIAGEKTIVNGKEIDFPCYGKSLGEISGTPSSTSTNYTSPGSPPQATTVPETDNWFCCNPR